MEQKRGFGRLDGFHIKLIAVITMLIDHLAAVILYNRVPFEVYEWLRFVGRIAFPIYCFLLVQGFLHTSNVKKYALRLGIFALISEIPFDLALYGTWWFKESNNVFFTLLIGLLVIWGFEYFQEKFKVPGIVMGVILIVLGCYVAEKILCCDYGMAGVATIVTMYLLRNKIRVYGFILGILVLTLLTYSGELFALIGAIPIWYYNGKRGREIKYFFYLFYPLHLLVLWALTLIL